MRLQLLTAFTLFFSFIYSMQAQEKCVLPEQGYLKSYFTDTRDLVVQPTEWKAKEWMFLGGAALTFMVIHIHDLDIQRTFQSNRNETTDWISKHLAEPIGSGLYTLPALGLLYGSGWLWDNPKNRYVALQASKAWLLTGGATLILKQLTHRQRPNEGEYPDPYYWLGPYALSSNNTSFPSGHASTAFAVATVIAYSYHPWWIKVSSYSLATLAGLSRIHDNKHWASDVFVGALLGWWVGQSMTKLHPAMDWGVSAGHDHLSGSLVWRF